MTAVFVHTEDLPEIGEILARRRELGQDTYDEVHENVYHIMPTPSPEHGEVVVTIAAFLKQHAPEGCGVAAPANIGVWADEFKDFRVPDVAVFRHDGARTSPAFFGRGACPLVVEVLSPGEDAHAKDNFYRGYGVEELLTIDWQSGRCWLGWRSVSGYQRTERSRVVPALLVTNECVIDPRTGEAMRLRG